MRPGAAGRLRALGARADHKAALGADGRDNGRPGIRDNYGPNYYAAYVLDPYGNNIEVVCQKAEGSKKAR